MRMPHVEFCILAESAGCSWIQFYLHDRAREFQEKQGKGVFHCDVISQNCATLISQHR